MGHELDPECRQNIQGRRFLVIAVGLDRVARETVPLVAPFGMRLRTGEKLAADHLGIGFEQAQTIAVSIPSEHVLAKIRKRRFELDISGKGLVGRTHEGIAQVVAGSVEIAETDEFTAAELLGRAAHRVVIRVALRQPHRIPDLQC